MDIEFDTAKDAANIAKHGYPLADGAAILVNPIGQREDQRRQYGETRVNAFGWIEGRLTVCTYTIRGDVYRIISVRRASKKEQRTWLS